MDHIARHSAETIIAALERGDEASVRRDLSRILDAGDTSAIEETVRCAARSGKDSSWLLEGALEDEAQRLTHDGFQSALFCIPVMLDPTTSPIMYAQAITMMLEGMAAPGERFLVADGWVHPADVAALGHAPFRALTRQLGVNAWTDGNRETTLLPPDFPRFPASPCDLLGGVEVMGKTGDRMPMRVAARLVMGVVSRLETAEETPGGLFDMLVSGNISDCGMEALATSVDAAANMDTDIMRPGQPMQVAAAAATTLQMVGLEARFRFVAASIGAKPIAHYFVGETSVRVAMTRDGHEALDAVEIAAEGLDKDIVVDAVFAQSKGVVSHDCPDSLPIPSPQSLH